MNKERPLRRHITSRFFFRRDNILPTSGTLLRDDRNSRNKNGCWRAHSLFSLQMYKTVLSSFSRCFYRIRSAHCTHTIVIVTIIIYTYFDTQIRCYIIVGLLNNDMNFIFTQILYNIIILRTSR